MRNSDGIKNQIEKRLSVVLFGAENSLFCVVADKMRSLICSEVKVA